MRRPSSSSGFTLLEVLVCSAVICVAVLGHAMSVLTGQRNSALMQERGLAFSTLQRFIERMRADTDWAGLYARLKAMSAESGRDANLTFLGPDESLPVRAPTDYYADFDAPSRLGTVEILVQVPITVAGGTGALREDAVAPRYGLPADLNGDGVIDDNPRDDDRLALPVVVHLRWRRPGASSQEIVATAWLKASN
jgi:prepilin-type N-terminal cleavage/methylation domain-containing protein